MSSIGVWAKPGIWLHFFSRFFGIPLEVVGLNEQRGGGGGQRKQVRGGFVKKPVTMKKGPLLVYSV